jgi:hypothetical protein
MESLIDLNKLSKDNRKEIEEIIKKESKSQNEELRKFLEESRHSKNGRPKSRQSKRLFNNQGSSEMNTNGIILDTKSDFDKNLPTFGFIKMQQRRIDGKLNNDDIETYRQLGIIHENGIVNFWKKIKIVVESKEDVDL